MNDRNQLCQQSAKCRVLPVLMFFVLAVVLLPGQAHAAGDFFDSTLGIAHTFVLWLAALMGLASVAGVLLGIGKLSQGNFDGGKMQIIVSVIGLALSVTVGSLSSTIKSNAQGTAIERPRVVGNR